MGGEGGIDIEGGGVFGHGKEAAFGLGDVAEFLGGRFAGSGEKEGGGGENAGAQERGVEEVAEAVVLDGLVFSIARAPQGKG